MGPGGPFQACTAALEDLAKKLKVLNEASAVRRRLLWPIEGSKFEEVLRGLEKHKSMLLLAVVTQGREDDHKIKRDVEETKLSVSTKERMSNLTAVRHFSRPLYERILSKSNFYWTTGRT
jgi:hypothetical protein